MLRTFAMLAAAALAAFGLQWLLGELVQDWLVRIINLCGIAIILAVSLNVINGLTGQFSLGHAGFMAIGAYVSAFFTTSLPMLNHQTGATEYTAALLPGVAGFVPALLAGGIAAAGAGVLVGIPTLRLRGDYLAIATVGFGEFVRVIFNGWEKLGGARGISNLPPHTNAGFIFAFVGAVIVLSVHLQRSTFGRALIAIRENELAAEVMGVRSARLKVMAFAYGAFFAGVAGGLLGHLNLFIDPRTFDLSKSVEPVVMLVLGGLGSITGACVGAVAITLLPELLRPLEEGMKDAGVEVTGIRMVVYSLVLILLMLFRPQGIFGQRELSLRLLRSLLPGGRDKGNGKAPSVFSTQQSAEAKTFFARAPQTLPPESGDGKK